MITAKEIAAMRETIRNFEERKASPAHGPISVISILPDTLASLLAAAERERVLSDAVRAWYKADGRDDLYGALAKLAELARAREGTE